MSRRYQALVVPESSTQTVLTPGPTAGNSFRGAGSATDFGSIFVPIPAAIQVGDLMVAFVAISPKRTINVPGGWTLIRQDQGPGGTDMTLYSLWKRRLAGETSTSQLFTWLGGTAEAFGAISAYFGIVATGNPIHASSGQQFALGSGVTSFTIPAVTNVLLDTMLVAGYSIDLNGFTYTPPLTPNTMLERVDQPGGTGFMSGGVADERRTFAGSTGTRLITFSPASAGGTREACGQLISLVVDTNNTYRDSTLGTVESGLSVVIPRPNIVLDDVMVAFVASNPAQASTPPAGWTAVRSDIQGSLRQDVWWRRADAADVLATDFTFTFPAATDGNGVISAYFNVLNPGNPIEAHAGLGSTSSSLSISIPTVSPVTNQTMFIAGYGTSDDAVGGFTPPVGLAEREDSIPPINIEVSVGLADMRRTYVTPTGPLSATHTGAVVVRDKIGQSVLLTLGPAASSSFEGDPMDVQDYSGIRLFAFADRDSNPAGLQVLFSDDADLNNLELTDRFTVSGGRAFSRRVPVRAKWARVRYVNGPVSQSEFRLQTLLLSGQGGEDAGVDTDDLVVLTRQTGSGPPSVLAEVFRMSETQKNRTNAVVGFGISLNEIATPIGGDFRYLANLLVGGVAVSSFLLSSGEDGNWFDVNHRVAPGDDVTATVLHQHQVAHNFVVTVESREY